MTSDAPDQEKNQAIWIREHWRDARRNASEGYGLTYKAPTLDNLLAIVEVKFPGDPFKKEQKDKYDEEFKGVPLALIRVPEDCDCDKLGATGKKKPKIKGGK